MEIELECFKRANGVVEALQAYNDEYLYYLNGNLLKLPESLTFRQHSPTGFSHGYAGSGPAQLALAICLKLYSKATALKVYQYFKTHFIATIPYQEDFIITLEVPDDPLNFWKIIVQDISEQTPIHIQEEVKLMAEDKKASTAKAARRQRIEYDFQRRLNLKDSFRFEFKGLNKTPSFCYLNIIKDQDQVWVIATDAGTTDEDAGTSVTNGAELIATQICEQYQVKPYQLCFVERYVRKPLNSHQDTVQETWDEVTFTFHSSGLKHPKWRPLSQEEIQILENKL